VLYVITSRLRVVAIRGVPPDLAAANVLFLSAVNNSSTRGGRRGEIEKASVRYGEREKAAPATAARVQGALS